mmetsp:Transcript_1894/g.3429  ORF Transcript_1894/g.3429 Transcript_1894/m.3429 type:complete len:170 (+) Transcript_1894:987-1496(+)
MLQQTTTGTFVVLKEREKACMILANRPCPCRNCRKRGSRKAAQKEPNITESVGRKRIGVAKQATIQKTSGTFLLLGFPCDQMSSTPRTLLKNTKIAATTIILHTYQVVRDLMPLSSILSPAIIHVVKLNISTLGLLLLAPTPMRCLSGFNPLMLSTDSAIRIYTTNALM